MAVIGRLAISLGLNTAELRTDLKKSRRSIKRFSNRIKRSFRNLRRSVLSAINPFSKLKLAIIGIAGPAALGFLIKSSLDSIDALGKVSDKLGIATERLVGMRLAAELTGVGAKTLDMAIQRMTRRISEAAMGTGEAKNAIKELGLSAQDLANSTPDQAFIKISEAMKQVENQSDRVRLSFKLFDSEGVALVNTLRLGRDGLEAIQVEAELLGLTMSRDAVKGVEETNDSITRLMTLFRGLSNQITAALSPAINLAVTSFKDFIIETAASEGGIKKFAQNMAIDILSGIQSVLSGFGSMFDIIEKVKFALIDIGAIDDTELLRAEKLHASILQKTDLVVRARKAGLGTLETTVRLQKEAESELEEIGKIQESINNRGKEGLSVIDKTVVKMGEMIAKTKELRNATDAPSAITTVADAATGTGVTPEIRQSLETRVEMIRASLLTQTQIENESFARDLASLKQANTSNVGEVIENNTLIEDIKKRHIARLESITAQTIVNDNSAIIEQERSIRALMTPLENYQNKLLEINGLWQGGLLGGVENYERAVKRAADTFAKANEINIASADQFVSVWQSAAQSFSSGIGNAIGSLITQQTDFATSMKNVVLGVMNQIISGMIKLEVQKSLSFTSGIAQTKASAAVQVSANASIAASAAPAAAGVSLASFGANSVPAIAGILATIAAVAAISGARADGGPVQSGKSFLVGELGPEIFVPNQNGGIIPNNAINGSGKRDVNVTIVYSPQLLDGREANDFISRRRGQLEAIAIGAINKAFIESGGS